MTDNNGAQSNMFAITALQETTISDFAMNLDGGTATTIDVYYRPDNYLTVPGSNTAAAGWSLLGSATNVTTSATTYTDIPVGVNLTIPQGETYSFHIAVEGVGVNYTNGSGLGNVFASNISLEFLEGHGGGGLFDCNFSPRVWNGLIRYDAIQYIDVTWFDLPTGGTIIAEGSPSEAIGTSVLPDASTVGNYSFYVASNNNGCYSVETEEVVVHVSNVNVYMSSVDATCNTGTDGSFVGPCVGTVGWALHKGLAANDACQVPVKSRILCFGVMSRLDFGWKLEALRGLLAHEGPLGTFRALWAQEFSGACSAKL